MTSASTAPQQLGRYRVVSELGRGAMGVVYRGEDSAIGRPVAIKTIHMALAEEDQAGYLARFRQEAKALGALNHPSIITLYDYGHEGEVAYMALEYLEGRELRDLLSESRITLASALDIAAQVAEGLAYAHSRDIVHRDVKPGNIMLLAGNRVKLMDFGIARVRASDVKTRTGLLLGSPKYMSPEQVLGRPVDRRSDVFSLGVVLYEMLAGIAPFSGADVPQLMYRICNAQPPAPSRLQPGLPEMVDLVVARALEKDPAARYQDAAELAKEIRECIKALPLDAPSVADTTVPAKVLEATMAQVMPPAGGGIGLAAWRRFDSGRALERLAMPQGADRELLSPSGPPGGFISRVRRDRILVYWTGMVAAGAALAVALVLV